MGVVGSIWRDYGVVADIVVNGVFFHGCFLVVVAFALIITFTLLVVVVVVGVEIEIGHELRFYVINRFTQCLDEFVEVFFVQKDFMPVVSIGIKFLTAFCNSEIVVISTGSSYIKEVGSSFSSADALTVDGTCAEESLDSEP